MEKALLPAFRPLAGGGDALGTHRGLEPAGALPQPALRVDNDFSRLFAGEVLVAVETLNLDAASFRQMEEAHGLAGVAGAVLATVAVRGKQHNPVTGSGGMLLGRVLQVAPPLPGEAPSSLVPGDRVATLASLSLTPLRLDRVGEVRAASAQLDVEGEAVLFASAPRAKLPHDFTERLALAALDVAGAAPQVARRVRAAAASPSRAPGAPVSVLVLGAGGKSGILCVAAAREALPSARILGVESYPAAADDLRALGLCDAVLSLDAREPLALRDAVLGETGGAGVDLCISCVSVEGAEMGSILATRTGGAVYFFAMSTSFTRAALGAEGVGRDVDLFIGNGFAEGHAEFTLDLLRRGGALRALFERRYGSP